MGAAAARRPPGRAELADGAHGVIQQPFHDVRLHFHFRQRGAEGPAEVMRREVCDREPPGPMIEHLSNKRRREPRSSF